MAFVYPLCGFLAVHTKLPQNSADGTGKCAKKRPAPRQRGQGEYTGPRGLHAGRAEIRAGREDARGGGGLYAKRAGPRAAGACIPGRQGRGAAKAREGRHAAQKPRAPRSMPDKVF